MSMGGTFKILFEEQSIDLKPFLTPSNLKSMLGSGKRPLLFFQLPAFLCREGRLVGGERLKMQLSPVLCCIVLTLVCATKYT